MRPNPSTIVAFAKTPAGHSVFGSRYLAYHWARTYRRFKEQFPDAEVYILQGAYNKGVPQSAGTHDWDGVLDVWVTGVDWRDAERFFREEDWIGWWRHTGSWARSSKFHIHMISAHTPNRKGSLIPSQLASYAAGRLGLARSVDGRDPAPHPTKINRFDYDAWLRQLEEDKMNHVQKADAFLTPTLENLDKAIAELKLVDVSRTGARAKISVLVTARGLIAGVAKFLVI